MVMHFLVLAFAFATMGFLTARGAPLTRRGNDDYCPYKAGDVHILELQPHGPDTTLMIKFLGAGDFGCAYEVAEGWPLPDGKTVSVVAKTSRTDKDGKGISEDEIRALSAIGELYHQARDDADREWIIMPRKSGKVVTDTASWKQRFPEGYNMDQSPEGIAKCEGFMLNIYSLVATKIEWYVATYGWEHTDKAWGNFLFDDDLTSVNIIDIGLAEQVDPSKAVEIHDKWMKILEERSRLPIRDVLTPTWNRAGICQSDLRPWLQRASYEQSSSSDSHSSAFSSSSLSSSS